VTMTERRELPRCAAHGLSYDPTVRPGCVLCRNSRPPVAHSSLPPAAPGSALVGSFPPYGTPSAGSEAIGPAGIGGWTIARLILISLCAALLTLLSLIEAPTLMMSYHVGLGLSASLIAAMFCLPLARYRNLASFSKLALVFSVMGVMSTLPQMAKKASASSDPWPANAALVDRKASTGNLTLRVPESWRFESRSNESGLLISMLQSPDASVFAWTTEKSSDFAEGVSMLEYAELMRRLYEERLETNIGPGEAATLGDVPAMRFAFDGTRERVRVKGYLYVAKGRPDFCHLLAFVSPSKFDSLEKTLPRVVENAIVD
jgi:hypothetical protein